MSHLSVPRHRVRVDDLMPQMTLGTRETRHLHVLRLGVGAQVLVFDGQGQEAHATVTALDTEQATLSLGERTESTPEFPQPVTLAVALLKGDKLADVVRAATELGVSSIQLLITSRADAREIGEQKLLRLRRVAAEASKQSRRALTPQIYAPLPLAHLHWQGQLFVAQPGSQGRLIDLLDWTAPITILTGPEGGLTAAEVLRLTEQGAQAVTLGPRILRAETAPVALLGAIAATGQ